MPELCHMQWTGQGEAPTEDGLSPAGRQPWPGGRWRGRWRKHAWGSASPRTVHLALLSQMSPPCPRERGEVVSLPGLMGWDVLGKGTQGGTPGQGREQRTGGRPHLSNPLGLSRWLPCCPPHGAVMKSLTHSAPPQCSWPQGVGRTMITAQCLLLPQGPCTILSVLA